MPFTHFPQLNATSYMDIMEYGNTVTGNLFGLLILASIFLITFLAMLRRNNTDPFKPALGSLYVSFVAGAIMWTQGLIKEEVLVLIIVLIAALLFINRD